MCPLAIGRRLAVRCPGEVVQQRYVNLFADKSWTYIIIGDPLPALMDDWTSGALLQLKTLRLNRCAPHPFNLTVLS